MIAMLHYSHNPETLPDAIYFRCLWHNRRIAHEAGALWISVVARQTQPDDIIKPRTEKPLYADLYERIILGCNAAIECEVSRVFLCEHDNLYHASHLDHEGREPAYDINLRYLCQRGITHRGKGEIALSMLSGNPYEIKAMAMYKLHQIYEKRFNCFEPTHGVGTYCAEFPSLDVRHGANTSWALAESTPCVPSVPGWDDASTLIEWR